MGHDHVGRLARAREGAGAAGLDGLILSPSPDLIYLAGYDAPLLERLTVLVLRTTADPVLIVPELERPRAASSPAGQLVEIRSWRDGEDAYELVRTLIGAGHAYGASDRMWAAHLLQLQEALPDAKFVPSSTVLSALRERKDEGEIELLRRAGQSADEAFARVCSDGLEGRSERDVARSLEEFLVATGTDTPAFTIVGSGPNSASPHHEPGERVIKAGDTVVLDFGGRVGGYCSDITRTVVVGERPAEVEEVHGLVREAQEAALGTAAPGVPAEEVDRAARSVIEKAGYGDAFVHRTGHGIGLEEHEAPYIVEGNDETLEPGMCFSIEPGIYLEGRFGVRIEDIVAIMPGGPVRLNDAPRDLSTVG
ncbi:MAG TPA: Xaa-Pro peptidase family protein [Actinomycetota bacterium]|nr:Xaa-Pro peptidase family protein [Actinomycetota bacterium]